VKKGWEIRRIGNLGKVQTGSTPKTSEKNNFGDFIPFIKPSDFINDGSLNYTNEGLSEIGIAGSRLIPQGSVLIV
jgi:type I restriction enzyme, S subunit